MYSNHMDPCYTSLAVEIELTLTHQVAMSRRYALYYHGEQEKLSHHYSLAVFQTIDFSLVWFVCGYIFFYSLWAICAVIIASNLANTIVKSSVARSNYYKQRWACFSVKLLVNIGPCLGLLPNVV